jgi:hypothetical protein
MESIESLHDRLETLENLAQAFAKQTRAAERRLHCWRRIAYGLLILGMVSLPLAAGITAQDESSEYKGIRKRLAALEYKLQYISGGANEVVITGANLRIVNGLGSTETANGLGNLIVGYNEERYDCPTWRPPEECTNSRTGSHNLIVGKEHNFSSFGGAAVGLHHQISGIFASVTGGVNNEASGLWSTVSGGVNNVASGVYAVVSAGVGNHAAGGISSISGGSTNIASGDYSSISGGSSSEASGSNSWLAGGANNIASGTLSSVSGGRGNTASGESSSVSGGKERSAPGLFNWAAGPLFAND